MEKPDYLKPPPRVKTKTVTKTVSRTRHVKVSKETKRQRAAKLLQEQKVAKAMLKERPDWVEPLITGNLSGRLKRIARDALSFRLQSYGSPRQMTDEQVTRFLLMLEIGTTDNEAVRTRLTVKAAELNILKPSDQKAASSEDLATQMREHFDGQAKQMEQRLKLEIRRKESSGSEKAKRTTGGQGG